MDFLRSVGRLGVFERSHTVGCLEVGQFTSVTWEIDKDCRTFVEYYPLFQHVLISDEPMRAPPISGLWSRLNTILSVMSLWMLTV